MVKNRKDAVLFVWLVGWVGWLVGLVGWLVGCLSVRPSVCLSVRLPGCLSVCLSVLFSLKGKMDDTPVLYLST